MDDNNLLRTAVEEIQRRKTSRPLYYHDYPYNYITNRTELYLCSVLSGGVLRNILKVVLWCGMTRGESFLKAKPARGFPTDPGV